MNVQFVKITFCHEDSLKGHSAAAHSSAFSIKTDLKQHINAVHLNVRPFKCSECPLFFAKKFTMKKHFKRFHEKPENQYAPLLARKIVTHFRKIYVKSETF